MVKEFFSFIGWAAESSPQASGQAVLTLTVRWTNPPIRGQVARHEYVGRVLRSGFFR